MDAAAPLHDVTTALTLLDLTAVGPRSRVLVVGASGGLRHALVQLATARGAHVVATVRGARKLARLAGQGARATLDTAEPGWADLARHSSGGGADVVLDNVGGALGAVAVDVLAPGGHFSGHGAPGGGFATISPADAGRLGATVTVIPELQLTPTDRRARMVEALAAAAQALARPVIGQRFRSRTPAPRKAPSPSAPSSGRPCSSPEVERPDASRA